MQKEKECSCLRTLFWGFVINRNSRWSRDVAAHLFSNSLARKNGESPWFLRTIWKANIHIPSAFVPPLAVTLVVNIVTLQTSPLYAGVIGHLVYQSPWWQFTAMNMPFTQPKTDSSCAGMSNNTGDCGLNNRGNVLLCSRWNESVYLIIYSQVLYARIIILPHQQCIITVKPVPMKWYELLCMPRNTQVFWFNTIDYEMAYPKRVFTWERESETR